jgi:hypothetical protein
MNNKHCQNCVALVEGPQGEWICDEKQKPISEIEICPETTDKDKYVINVTISSEDPETGELKEDHTITREGYDLYQMKLDGANVIWDLIELGQYKSEQCLLIEVQITKNEEYFDSDNFIIHPVIVYSGAVSKFRDKSDLNTPMFTIDKEQSFILRRIETEKGYKYETME